MSSRYSKVLFMLTGLVFLGISLLLDRLSKQDQLTLQSNAAGIFEQRIRESEKLLQLMAGGLDNEEESILYKEFQKNGFGVYLFNGNKLSFWNNSQIPANDSLSKLPQGFGAVSLRQGTYLYVSKIIGQEKAIVLSMIRSKYDLENNHLKNGYAAWTQLPEEIIPASDGNLPISVNGTELLKLRATQERYNCNNYHTLALILFISGSILFFLSLLAFVKRNSSVINLTLSVVAIAAYRFIIFYWSLPSFLENSFLYDVRTFGNADSQLNTTIGDILINGVTLFLLTMAITFQFSAFINSKLKNGGLVILFLLGYIISWQFNHTIRSLVVNSTLAFDFMNIFDVKPTAIFAIGSLVINAISVFVLFYKALSYFNQTPLKAFLYFTGCVMSICIGLFISEGQDHSIYHYWPPVFSTGLFLLVRRGYERISIALGLLIAILSVSTARMFSHYIEQNQKADMYILADKLSERQDLYMENEFTMIPQRIESDGNLMALIDLLPITKKEIDQLIRQKYFKGYFNTYNIEMSMFDKDCKPLLEPSIPILMNEGFFEDQIKYYSDSTMSEHLFFVRNYKKNSRYIGKIKFPDRNLYFLLEKKQFEELGSFPDLLLDQSQQKPEKSRNFSHAVYRDGRISSSFGEINYPPYLSEESSLSQNFNTHDHHYFQPEEGTTVIISSRKKDWKYQFTYNSYFFLYFSVISFISYYVYAMIFTARFRSASLTRRIQTVIIILLFMTMSAIGITSARLVISQFESDNVKQLQDKTQTIMSELFGQFKPEMLFSIGEKDLVNLKLQEYSHLYKSDISIYDSTGRLFNTSQPKLYEMGLSATLANPIVYKNLKHNISSSIHTTEKAGTLKFISLYTPVFNEKKQILGFINLPYFAKQSDLTNELSGIISAFINVYIILFVISIVAGILLSDYITKPLQLIKQQISSITLGKQNESLKWSSNDEVGKLIQEYNNMLLKLEHSANMLAQSERESAWREMAKQVAHEIKNPLTPMKLNLQYLQHVLKNNPQEFREKFEKSSASIIEQIDSLAVIATEFSNFAKLPGTKLENIRLNDIIHASVELFAGEDHVKIFNHIHENDLIVKGDKEQALRVFNNVIKNAVQATQDVNDGAIHITAEVNENMVIIAVRDNGCGIDEKMKPVIFTPNFTTKTTGSGLGLAMVKNIMSGFGGTIRFESIKDEGTVFYIEFVKSGA